jgi:hypothetical protein
MDLSEQEPSRLFADYFGGRIAPPCEGSVMKMKAIFERGTPWRLRARMNRRQRPQEFSRGLRDQHQ